MCNCNRNNINNIRNLAIKYKKMNNNCQVAIYKLFQGYNFCELDRAIKLNYNIIEII